MAPLKHDAVLTELASQINFHNEKVMAPLKHGTIEP